MFWRSSQRTELGLGVAIVVAILLIGIIDSQHTYFVHPRPSAVDILRQTALLGIFTLGAAIVIIAGGIDLSSGSVIAFSGTICASLLVLMAPEEMRLKIKWYRFDSEAFARLDQRNLPEQIRSKLQPLQDRIFENEDDFRQELQQRLGADEFKGHEGELLTAAVFNKPLGIGIISLAIAGTMVVGFLIGSLHAWLITVIGLPPFVATLATLVGLRSLGRAIIESVTENQFQAKSNQIQVFDIQFRYLATSVWIPVVLFVVLTAVCCILMRKTVAGRHLHALGGNEQAARLSGIRTDHLKWLAYCISALLASVAGVLFIGQESVADPQRQGVGYELNAIAASVVGGCSLRGGVGTIPGAVLGALFLRTVIDGVAKIIKTGADVYEGLIVGAVVVVAVTFTQLRQAGGRGKRFFPGSLGLVSMVTLAILIGVLAKLFAHNTGLGGNKAGGIAAAAALVLLGLAWFAEQRREKRAAQAATVPAAPPK
jgi:ribose/xylose/arabinose/galactoside ABC-type transport system permease subunit